MHIWYGSRGLQMDVFCGAEYRDCSTHLRRGFPAVESGADCGWCNRTAAGVCAGPDAGCGEEGELESPHQRRRAVDIRFRVSPCPAGIVAPPILFIRCDHNLHMHNQPAVIQVMVAFSNLPGECAKLADRSCPI